MAGTPDILVFVIFMSASVVHMQDAAGCAVDIFVVLDTSRSIGESNFQNKVKPFLELLGNNSDLDISPSGSHIGVITFSSVENTKLRLSFKKGQHKKLYLKVIRNMRWNIVEGGHTRTDLAFEEVDKIFKHGNPLNHRKTYNDIVILLTDGEPHGIANAMERTVAAAQKLKDRGIRIFGLGVGNINMENLKAISSPGDAMLATFENINTKLDHLVSGSCQALPAKTCDCPVVDLGDFLIDSEMLKRQIWWNIPTPSCSSKYFEASLIKTSPNVRPGNSFSFGAHNIQYTYNVKGTTQSIHCDIQFTIKGKKQKSGLCSNQTYTLQKEICCCGKIYEATKNYMCCGTSYISENTHQCCPIATVRRLYESCTGPRSHQEI